MTIYDYSDQHKYFVALYPNSQLFLLEKRTGYVVGNYNLIKDASRSFSLIAMANFVMDVGTGIIIKNRYSDAFFVEGIADEIYKLLSSILYTIPIITQDESELIGSWKEHFLCTSTSLKLIE